MNLNNMTVRAKLISAFGVLAVLVLLVKPEQLAAEKTAVTQAHEDVQARLTKLKEMARAPGVPEEVRASVGKIDQVEQACGSIALDIVGLALGGKRDEAITKMNDDCRPHLAALVSVWPHSSPQVSPAF